MKDSKEGEKQRKIGRKERRKKVGRARRKEDEQERSKE